MIGETETGHERERLNRGDRDWAVERERQRQRQRETERETEREI